MRPLTVVLLNVLVFVIGTLTCRWLLHLARRDASVVDPFWGTGFIVVAWFWYRLDCF